MILVTGGTGLIGAHLLYDLAKSGEQIKAIHRKSSNLPAVKKVFSYYTTAENAEFLYNSIEWIEADINDVPALEIAFKGVQRVYHCAALISFVIGDDKHLRKTNIRGTANIVNLCIANSVEKLCFVSSTASLGKPVKGKFITEESPWNPEDNHSDYAISKYGAEIEVWRASQEGIPVVIVNPGIVIGPGFWESGSGPIFKRVDKGFKFHFPKITGFVGVKDVVKAMRAGMEAEIKNQQYILIAENLSFKKILALVADELHKARPDRPLKKWMIMVAYIFQKIGRIFGGNQQLTQNSPRDLYQKSYFSNEKAKQELNIGFTPIAEVIKKTAQIYQEEN